MVLRSAERTPSPGRLAHPEVFTNASARGLSMTPRSSKNRATCVNNGIANATFRKAKRRNVELFYRVQRSSFSRNCDAPAADRILKSAYRALRCSTPSVAVSGLSRIPSSSGVSDRAVRGMRWDPLASRSRVADQSTDSQDPGSARASGRAYLAYVRDHLNTADRATSMTLRELVDTFLTPNGVFAEFMAPSRLGLSS